MFTLQLNSRQLRRRLALLIVVAVLAIYAGSLNAPFVFDDNSNIAENSQIKELDSIAPLFDLGPRRIFVSRFVGYLSFAINYQLHGLNVLGFHLFNVALHLANALLLFLLLLRTWRAVGQNSASFGRDEESERRVVILSGVAALIFAVHPLQSQAVSYIVQRFAVLATFFILLALLGYLAARRSRSRGGRIGYYLLSLGAAFLAMRSKEIAYVLPLLVLLYELTFLRATWRERLYFCSGHLLILLLMLIPFLLLAQESGSLTAGVGDATNLQSKLSRFEYLFTQFRVIVLYLRLVILPVRQSLIYDLEPSYSFFEPAVLLSFLFLLAVVGGGIYQLIKLTRRTAPGDHSSTAVLHDWRRRLFVFGLIWFFIGLSVESSLIPIRDLVFEHRLYLPLLGGALALVTGFQLAITELSKSNFSLLKSEAGSSDTKAGSRHRFEILFFTLLLIVFAVLAIKRNYVWSSPEHLWHEAVNRAPTSAGGYSNLGLYYQGEGNYGRAIELYRQGLMRVKRKEYVFRPDYDFTLLNNNLGRAYLDARELELAYRAFSRAIELEPLYLKPYLGVGDYFLIKRDFEKALRFYGTVYQREPESFEANIAMGDGHFGKQEYETSLKYYQAALKIDSKNPVAYKRLVMIYRNLGERELQMHYQRELERIQTR